MFYETSDAFFFFFRNSKNNFKLKLLELVKLVLNSKIYDTTEIIVET